MKGVGQFGEDEIEIQLLNEIPKGYAVDVGAYDGLLYSNTLLLERAGWDVLCIEPNPELTEKLKQDRKRVMAVACSSKAEPARELHVVETTISGTAASTGFDPSLCPREFMPPIVGQRSYTVEVRTLDECLNESGFPRLDYLSLDTEGHEMEVLKGFSIARWSPLLAVVEDWHDAGEIDEYFRAAGYRRLTRMGVNNVYTRRAKDGHEASSG